MKYRSIIFSVSVCVHLLAQDAAVDVRDLTAHLFQLIAHAGPQEELVPVCEQLETHPQLSATQLLTIAAHGLARSYHHLVRLNKKQSTLMQKRTSAVATLTLSGYFLASVFANRIWNSGLGKKSRSGWFWFPLARACSLDEDNHIALGIGLGLFWTQLILSPFVGLTGIYWGISASVMCQRKIKTVRAKQHNLKLLIKQLEELYYESQS